MTSYFTKINGFIKYIAIIDRDNFPKLFFNLDNEELELSYQLLVFSCLDLLMTNTERKRFIRKSSVTSRKNEEGTIQNEIEVENDYKGLLMPFYEFEQDIGAYGFVGNNGVKICIIKKLEIQNPSSDAKLEMICKDLYIRINKLLLNPFYDKKEFNLEKSSQRDKFCKGIFEMLEKNQII